MVNYPLEDKYLTLIYFPIFVANQLLFVVTKKRKKWEEKRKRKEEKEEEKDET